MEEILSKRITLLSNAIIVLSAIGFLALVHHIDARYKEKEYVALNALRNCIEAIPANADHSDQADAAAKSWLMQNRKADYQKNIQLADAIALELTQAGFSKELKTFKTTDGVGNNLAEPAGFVLLNIFGTDTGNCCEHGFGNLNGNHKLKYFSQQYAHLKTGTKIRIATGMKPNAVLDAINHSSFSKTKDKFAHEIKTENPETENEKSIPLEIPDDLPFKQHAAKILKVDFTWDSCFITITGSSLYLQGEMQETIGIPLEAETIEGPSWFDLYGIDSIYKRLDTKTELQKIVRHYGDLPIDKAVDMIGDDYMDAFENVDIFGFSFSTTSLPLALLLFFSFLSGGLFLMVKEAEKLKLKVITEFNNEDITDYFIKRPFIRTTIWLFLPLLSLLATLPVLPVEFEKLAVLGAGSVILIAVNSLTLMKAKKL